MGEVIRSSYQESLKDFVSTWCNYIDNNINTLFRSNKDKKIAISIIDLFRNNGDIDIHNKKFLYILIREKTGYDSLNITKIVKILKSHFYNMFSIYLKTGKFF
jgi:hypothetical protein